MQEYEDWTSNPIPDTVDKAYQKALAKLEKCMPLEDALVSNVVHVLEQTVFFLE